MRTSRPRGGVPALGPGTAPLGLAIAQRRPGPCASVESAPRTQLPGPRLWGPGTREARRLREAQGDPGSLPRGDVGGTRPGLSPTALLGDPHPPLRVPSRRTIPPGSRLSLPCRPSSAPLPLPVVAPGSPPGGQRWGSRVWGWGGQTGREGVGLRAGPAQASGAPGGRPPRPGAQRAAGRRPWGLGGIPSGHAPGAAGGAGSVPAPPAVRLGRFPRIRSPPEASAATPAPPPRLPKPGQPWQR